MNTKVYDIKQVSEYKIDSYCVACEFTWLNEKTKKSPEIKRRSRLKHKNIAIMIKKYI